MREQTRNFVVGLTVAGGLVVLCGMIILFRELPAFMHAGYEVRFHFKETGGVTPGSDIRTAGMKIGRISKVDFIENDPAKGVVMLGYIEENINIPGNVNAYVYQSGLVALGGPKGVDLVSDGKPPGDKRVGPDGKPQRYLPKDNSVVIQGEIVGGGMELLPPDLKKDVTDTLASIRRLSDTMNAFLAAPPEQAAVVTTQGSTTQGTSGPTIVVTTTSAPRAVTLQETLAKFNTALDSINVVIGDTQNQKNIKEMLVKLNGAAGSADLAMKELRQFISSTQGSVNTLTTQASDTFTSGQQLIHNLIADADRLGNILKAFEKVTDKLDSVEGSLGKLLNDPALYRGLTETVTQMKGTLTGLQQLVEDWKKRGMKIRM